MTKTKRQVTLSDTTIAALEKEGLGSLSVGIELLFRDSTRSAAPQAHKPRERTLDLPDDDPPVVVDSRNPTNHQGTAIRLAKEDAARQGAINKYRASFRNTCVDIFIGSIPESHLSQYMTSHATYLTPDDMWSIYDDVKADADGSVAKAKADYWAALNKLNAERKAEAANYELMLAMGHSSAEIRAKTQPSQTTRLSVKALRGLGLFGTPESMTDAQIAEINAEWESKPEPVVSVAGIAEGDI